MVGYIHVHVHYMKLPSRCVVHHSLHCRSIFLAGRRGKEHWRVMSTHSSESSQVTLSKYIMTELPRHCRNNDVTNCTGSVDAHAHSISLPRATFHNQVSRYNNIASTSSTDLKDVLMLTAIVKRNTVAKPCICAFLLVANYVNF